MIKLINMIFSLILFQSCQYLPEVSKAVEDMETQEAIRVIVDKECFQKDTDVQILIDVKNKDDKS